MPLGEASRLSFTSVNRSGCTNVTEIREAAGIAARSVAVEHPAAGTTMHPNASTQIAVTRLIMPSHSAPDGRSSSDGGAVYFRSPRRLSTMRRSRAAAWLTSLVTLGLLTLGAPMLPPAAAQAPGTLVLGLDQEPPTLDPHASPSAVTYQIIASVTENLVYKGPDGKLIPGRRSRGRRPRTAAV